MNEELKPVVPQRVAEINDEIKRQGSKGYSVAPTAPTYAPITTASLSPVSPLKVPPQTTPTTAEGVLAGAVSQAKSAAQQAQDDFNLENQRYLEQQKMAKTEQESKVRGIFNNILGLKEQKTELEKEAGIPQLNTKVREIAQRIEDTDKARVAEIAALETQGLTGTGSAIAQAGINRKYAIQQLAQNIELDAQTGRLDNLQRNIDSKIQLELEPLQMQYEFETNFLEANRADFTKAEERAFEAKRDATKRLLDEETFNKQSIGEFAKQVAANGADAGTISRVSSAKTMAEAIQAAGQYAGDVLDRQIKQAQLDKLNIETARIISESIPQTAKQETESLSTINDINNILSSNAIDQTFGITSIVSRNVPGTESYGLSKQVNNLINKLALAARGQLKGQGAVSDFEGRMLKEAQTALTLNMSPEQARAELAKVRGALATSSGGNALVKMTNPNTNESQFVEVSQAGINQAIKDGLQVEYQ